MALYSIDRVFNRYKTLYSFTNRNQIKWIMRSHVFIRSLKKKKKKKEKNSKNQKEINSVD